MIKIQYISSIGTMFTIRVYVYLWSDSGRNWRYTLAVSNTGMSAAFELKQAESSIGTHMNVKLIQLSSTYMQGVIRLKIKKMLLV